MIYRCDKKRIQDGLERFKTHKITTRKIVDENTALIRLDPCGPKSFGSFVEVCCLSFGHLLVHGDWDPILFDGYRGGGGWRGKIDWIGRSDFDYAFGKARLGMGREMDELDEDEFKLDILSYRKDKLVTADVAREAYNHVSWGDLQSAERTICEYDSELYGAGRVASWDVILAWVAVKRLNELLKAEEETTNSDTIITYPLSEEQRKALNVSEVKVNLV